MTTTPEASKQFRTDQVMQGSKAVSLIIPAGMKFVTVLNSTDNKVELYTGSISYESADVRDSLIQSVPYYNQTMPLPNDTYYTLVWRDGGATGVKVVTVIFTVESMNINGSTGAPGTNQNVVITADQANLAKSSQLPGNLVGGRLDVNVGNTVTANVTIQGKPNMALPDGVTVTNFPTTQQVGGTVNIGNLPATQPVSGNVGITGNVNTKEVVPTQFKTGRFTVTTSADPVVTVSTPARRVMLLADKVNGGNIFVGGGEAFFPLFPGAAIVVEIDNVNKIVAQGVSAGDTLYWALVS